MSFFKFSKEYTTSFGYKVSVLNIDRIYSTSESELSVSLLDGDYISIDKKDYYALEDLLLYESDSDSQSSSEGDSDSEGDSEKDSEKDSESKSEAEDDPDYDDTVPYNAPSSGYQFLKWIL
jgi:hypothetical protein